MPWQLPDHDPQTFDRNPLVAVICQLRFDPILKIAAGVPEFQDRIRSRFPLYEEREVRQVELDATGVRVREGTEHRFRCHREPTTVVLSDQSVSLEYRDHQHRRVLFEDSAVVFGALTLAYDAVSPSRLGLRYVNAIDRERIGEDLGSPADWSDLLAAAFLAIPESLATLKGTRFANEITSEMSPGAMTLRYGLLPAPVPPPEVTFRLDIDRYREESFAMEDVESTVKSFADDIFRVFRTAAGDDLVKWMGAKP